MRLINANVNSLNLRRLLLGFFILCQVATVAGQEITESFIVDELARTQSDPDSAISLAINAPRDFVFDFLTRRVHEYVSDARAVEFDHDSSVQAKQLGVGSERRIIMASDEFLLQRFLIIEPPSSFAYFVDMERSTLSAPLVYSISRYQLTETTPETTQLDIAVVYQSSTRLLAFLVRRGFNSALERDFDAAVAIIEADYLATQ